MWALNPQSRHLNRIGRFDQMLYFQCFWFYFILISLGNVLVDVIFIINTLFIFLLNLLKSFAILFWSKVITWNNMHLYAFIPKWFYFILLKFYFHQMFFSCIHMHFYFIFNQAISFVFFYFNFHTNAFICIHSERVLLIKSFC